jgi:hypothetical protein
MQAQPAPKVRKAMRALLGHLARLGPSASQATRAALDLQDLLAPPEQPAPKGPPARQERKGRPAQSVRPGKPVPKAPRVLKAPKA